MQPERTAMAWQRTAFAVAVGSLAELKFLTGPLGAAAIPIGIAGCLWALALYLQSRRRLAAGLASIAGEGAPAATPDHHQGRHVALTTAFAALAGLISLAVVALLAIR